jgi:transcription factor CP2 and related proteins
LTAKFCSSASGSSTFIAEPYAYREYFEQGYIPSRTTIYSDSETPTTSYEGRFSTAHTKGGSIYAKTVTSAAGLTVDLPSPDSGIGADAITPRDQNNIQQVMQIVFFCF